MTGPHWTVDAGEVLSFESDLDIYRVDRDGNWVLNLDPESPAYDALVDCVRDSATLAKARSAAPPTLFDSLVRLVEGQSLPPDMQPWRGAVLASLADIRRLLSEETDR